MIQSLSNESAGRAVPPPARGAESLSACRPPRRADSAFSVRSRLVSLAARSFQFIGKDDGEATPSLASFSGRSSGGRRFESALPYNM